MLFPLINTLAQSTPKVPDGVYYIKNNNSGTWYLWPSVTTNGTTHYQYLTTSNAISVGNVSQNNVQYGPFDDTYPRWVLKNIDPATNTIQLINPKLNKYIVIRPKSYGDRDVWLADTNQATDITYTYMVLYNNNNPYKISPYPGLNNVNTTSGYSLNSAQGTDRQWLTWSKSDNNNPRTGEAREGLIQFYSGGTPYWTFISALLPAPTINFNSTAGSFTFEYTVIPAGYDIIYTTDGTDPTISNGITLSEYDGHHITAHDCTVKAVVARYGVVLSEIDSLHVYPPSTPPDDPTINYSDDCSNMVTITSSDEADIYYTLDGSNPDDSSIPYNGPFSMTQIGTVKAIAYYGIVASGITTYNCATVYSVSPSISISGHTATISGNGTIYYTTDGTDPTTGSSTYSSPITIQEGNGTVIIKAMAVQSNLAPSCVVTDNIVTSYFIDTAEKLNNLYRHANEECIITADINAADFTSTINTFSGSLDGGLHTISGLTKPLFNQIVGGTVKNVILNNISVTGTGNTGAIANEITGTDTNIGSIYNCGILGTSSISGNGTGYVGSLVGLLDGYSRVVNCYSYATVSGGTETGGLVGYNNYASGTGDIRTMVMNCMYYGNTTVTAPIYGGLEISNNNTSKLNNYNYFINGRTSFTKANGALAADERFLTRFEFYRLLLNSNRELAACYATGSAANARTKMAKWVLDTEIAPYPILKAQGKYTSIINYDPDEAPETPETQKTLTVYITGTGVTTSQLTLKITDKDPAHYNYNYHKVQLPYFNDVGTGNYTDNNVVTGWEVTVSGGTGTFSTTDFDAPNYNFADRTCTGKDDYATSGRVFAQGAYFDVPEGVSSITIQPHWAKCVYISDKFYDNYGYATSNGGLTDFGQRFTDNKFNNQTVYYNFSSALTALNNLGRTNTSTVYDYAVVLVGNMHQGGPPQINNSDYNPFTIMSADLDHDNEPDFSMIYNHQNRLEIPPVRFDFLNIPSNVAAQKSSGEGIRIVGIFKPRGWFEITNTCLIHFNQFEYDWNRDEGKEGPLILHGGVYEQFISANLGDALRTTYIHLGGNVWFKQFCNGSHIQNNRKTAHHPISVTGGEYEKFYLTGTFNPNIQSIEDNVECYIDGGTFGEVAGAGHEQVKGDVTWLIDHADMDNFYGGGINTANPITGNISVTIKNSHVDIYCGGPKFGNMQQGKTVTTDARNTTFGTFYGAGYGGTAFYRQQIDDKTYGADNNYNTDKWQTWAANYKRGTYHNTASRGIGANFEYEFFDGSNDFTVARLYVNYATLSLAETQDVTSTLNGCTILNNFYGGGNLGKVNGTVTSTLEDCTVNGNVFGSGFSATAPTVDIMDCATGAFITVPSYNPNTGAYTPGVLPQSTTYTWSSTGSTKNPLTDDGDTHLIYTSVDLTTLGEVNNAILTIKGTTHVMGELGVFGGGEKSGGKGSITVNIQGGTIDNDVYGGGALANTNTGNKNNNNTVTTDRNVTVVNLYPGATIGHDVYGGGRGQKNPDIAATVYGNVTVNQYGAVLTAAYDTVLDVATSGRIFGCNNKNGTPMGSVTVIVKNTTAGSNTGYDLAAVYGGGNEAEYVPYNSGLQSCDHTTVIISPDDCDDISIHSVYGGGNAASTPATNVIINGAREIKYVFGGGNGSGPTNPGANVGYHDYSQSEYTGTTQADIDARKERFAYGTGVASTNVYSGTIHYVYGGSNTKGNIRESSVSMLDELSLCELHIDGIYGGGREAYMEGNTSVEMGCITGMTEIYGGSENADVGSNVELTITSGHFDKVFGGNNKGGRIFGSITVNIEQTGCVPITIGELYLGGNNAPYSVFGYGDEVPNQNVGTTDDPEYVTHYKPNEGDQNHSQIYDDPILHVRSFDSIGTIYGGGNGVLATMVGNPTVEINVTDGWVNGQYTGGKEKYSQYIGTPQKLDTNGVIDTVYGGGNAAKVIGSTNVLIGDSIKVDATLQSMSDLYDKVGDEGMKRGNILITRTSQDGVKTITYTVVDAENNPDPDKQPLTVKIKQTVNGATITGNVYGGGNEAAVTDSTNIQIGPAK